MVACFGLLGVCSIDRRWNVVCGTKAVCYMNGWWYDVWTNGDVVMLYSPVVDYILNGPVMYVE